MPNVSRALGRKGRYKHTKHRSHRNNKYRDTLARWNGAEKGVAPLANYNKYSDSGLYKRINISIILLKNIWGRFARRIPIQCKKKSLADKSRFSHAVSLKLGLWDWYSRVFNNFPFDRSCEILAEFLYARNLHPNIPNNSNKLILNLTRRYVM